MDGTGNHGRITKKDVLAYIETCKAEPAPEVVSRWETPAASDRDLFHPTEELFDEAQPAAEPDVITPIPGKVMSLSPIRKAIAEHMVMSKLTSPHVSTVMEANLSRVIQHQELTRDVFARDGVRLTFTAYFVAAAVAALKAFPVVNSSWADKGVMVHRKINVGVATALEHEGIIVPVIKNADSLSLLGLGRTVNDLAIRARSHQLTPDEVKGGTFTITNHGVSGSLFGMPIINQPQSGILGVGVIQKRVVVIDDAIAIRPMVYLSLTFDHRILDGATAD